jgi:nitroreductase
MEFLNLAKERYSCRKFKPDKIEKEKLELILEAGRVAPTAANFQPQRILVIDREEGLAKLKTCTPYLFNAPLALLICYDYDTCWKHKHSGKASGDVDASIVTTQMMLEATSLGLGSTWVAAFDHEKTRELFGIPEYLTPVALLPLGYPADDASPHPVHYKRFDINHTVFYNSFDGISKAEKHEPLY